MDTRGPPNPPPDTRGPPNPRDPTRGPGRAAKLREPPMRPPERAASAASMGSNAKSKANVAHAEARRPHQSAWQLEEFFFGRDSVIFVSPFLYFLRSFSYQCLSQLNLQACSLYVAASQPYETKSAHSPKKKSIIVPLDPQVSIGHPVLSIPPYSELRWFLSHSRHWIGPLGSPWHSTLVRSQFSHPGQVQS